jgi:hypothetical protein
MTFCTNGASVQAFFTYRVYVVSGHWWLAVPLWILELFDTSVVAAMVYYTTKSSGFLQFKEEYNGLVYMTLISCAVVRVWATALSVHELTSMTIDRHQQHFPSVLVPQEA